MIFRPAHFLFLALAVAATPAAAQTVYKCTTASGKVQFSDEPCANDTKQQTLEMTVKETATGTGAGAGQQNWVRIGEPVANPGGGNVRVDFQCQDSKGRTVEGRRGMFCNKELTQCEDDTVKLPGQKAEFGSMNQIATRICAQKLKGTVWIEPQSAGSQ